MPDNIGYVVPDYHLSIQGKEAQEEDTLMGHKECLRCPIVSKNKAGHLTKDCTRIVACADAIVVAQT